MAGLASNVVFAVLTAASAHAADPGPSIAAAVRADEVILQFKRPQLQAALLRAGEQQANTAKQAGRTSLARTEVQDALDTLGRRHGMALHYLQTLGVGSALVAITPAASSQAALDARIARLAADAEVQSIELNARMTHFRGNTR